MNVILSVIIATKMRIAEIWMVDSGAPVNPVIPEMVFPVTQR